MSGSKNRFTFLNKFFFIPNLLVVHEVSHGEKKCYLANFKPVRDSVYSEEKGRFIKCESGNFFMDDGAFHTAKVDSYLPNDYGLYCMSGNVAEMVVNWKNKTPGTKGGSWISDLPELMITGEDKNRGVTEAKAHIGFRVVVSHIL